MNKLATLTIWLLISGCAENTYRQQTFEEVNLQSKLHALYEKNGHKYWCSQPDYLACLNVMNSECEEQHSKHKNHCLNYAKEMVPSIERNSDVGDFAIAYGECAKGSYENTNKLNTETKQCLSESKIDKTIMLQSVYEVSQY